MGLFSFFRNNSKELNKENNIGPGEIPKNVFIEESEPKEGSVQNGKNLGINGIEAVYDFLQADYESKGFNDALANPDESYKLDNLRLFEQDLQIHVQRACTHYEDT